MEILKVINNVERKIMEARKLKTVTKEMAKVEQELSGLRVELPKSKSKVMDIQLRRERVVYKAKTGNVPAQEKLSKSNDELGAARVEQDDLATAIKQGEDKLKTLESELTSAKQKTGRELIREFGKTQKKEMVRIDAAMGEITDAVSKSKKGLAELRQELSDLDFRELNLESKFRRITAGFISSALYSLFPRDFDRSPHKIFRNRSLVEMAQGLFTAVADSPRQLTEDPDEGVIEVGLIDGLRVVSAEENMAHQVLADKMVAEAAQLRSEGIPA